MLLVRRDMLSTFPKRSHDSFDCSRACGLGAFARRGLIFKPIICVGFLRCLGEAAAFLGAVAGKPAACQLEGALMDDDRCYRSSPNGVLPTS